MGLMFQLGDTENRGGGEENMEQVSWKYEK